MDGTTWVDPAVTGWIQQHAIAIQVDVDAEPAVAKQLEIRAMPTVVAVKEGVEVDRAVGLKQPAEMLSWLDGVMCGETSLDKLQAEVAQQSTGMLGRMQLARALASAGKVDEATDAYVWLWEHMLEHEPAMFGVRASFMLAEIGDLCSRHASARAKFAALRDAALPRSQEALDSDSDPLMDWMLLNQALGEQERTLEWFDREREKLTAEPKRNRLLETILVPLLIQKERWADAGSLYADPVSLVKEHHEIIEQVGGHRPAAMDDVTFEDVRRQVIEQFENTARQVHRCLLAAGRLDDAAKVASTVREFDATISLQ
jgi:hypothetical protein